MSLSSNLCILFGLLIFASVSERMVDGATCTCTDVVGVCDKCSTKCKAAYKGNNISDICTPKEGSTPSMCACIYYCPCQKGTTHVTN
ncbi:hypothetical protein ABFS83_10G132300 [Erythranthe nasuta]